MMKIQQLGGIDTLTKKLLPLLVLTLPSHLPHATGGGEHIAHQSTFTRLASAKKERTIHTTHKPVIAHWEGIESYQNDLDSAINLLKSKWCDTPIITALEDIKTRIAEIGEKRSETTDLLRVRSRPQKSELPRMTTDLGWKEATPLPDQLEKLIPQIEAIATSETNRVVISRVKRIVQNVADQIRKKAIASKSHSTTYYYYIGFTTLGGSSLLILYLILNPKKDKKIEEIEL